MSTSKPCIEILDSVGIDVLEVGCAWQNKSPVQLDNYIGLGGFLAFNLALFWVVRVVGNRVKPST